MLLGSRKLFNLLGSHNFFNTNCIFQKCLIIQQQKASFLQFQPVTFFFEIDLVANGHSRVTLSCLEERKQQFLLEASIKTKNMVKAFGLEVKLLKPTQVQVPSFSK